MVLFTQKVFNLGAGAMRVESLMRELIPRKLTGLLRVTFDSCDGIIAFDEGEVVDGYEIFNKELLVKDRNGRHIVERQKAEPGKITIYSVQKDVVHTFLRTVHERSPQTILAWFSSLCN